MKFRYNHENVSSEIEASNWKEKGSLIKQWFICSCSILSYTTTSHIHLNSSRYKTVMVTWSMSLSSLTLIEHEWCNDRLCLPLVLSEYSVASDCSTVSQVALNEWHPMFCLHKGRSLSEMKKCHPRCGDMLRFAQIDHPLASFRPDSS